ncbi:MAG: hypothetical protein ABH865_06125 [Candidatus Omnitrophota bacterium]|nr:hypothetical protein [Candidatus Omnitrophota bacterium]
MQQPIAKVILAIALEREFDYLVCPGMRIETGTRVLIDFRGRKTIGIVIGLASRSNIPRIKPIIASLDEKPLLSAAHIRFAQRLSALYPYPLAEFLFMMLPHSLKRSRTTTALSLNPAAPSCDQETVFTWGGAFEKRFSLWKEKMRLATADGSAMVIFPQRSYLEAAEKIIRREFPGAITMHSYQTDRMIFSQWQASRSRSIIVGTRVSIFYYPEDLRLLVVEEENSPHYFQEEKPYYHLPEVARILARSVRANLIVSSDYPSLATYALMRKKEIIVSGTPPDEPKITILGSSEHKKRGLINPLIAEILRVSLRAAQKTVVLLNKKGFARIIACTACSHTITCPRCSVFLHLDLDALTGTCPYCAGRQTLPKRCPRCKTGYLKGIGIGIERLRTILEREFPGVAIATWDARNAQSQIIVATSKILSDAGAPKMFDNGILLDIDAAMARPEYEATFDAFLYIRKLARLFGRAFYVWTRNPTHYLFSTINEGWETFYEHEFSLRSQLKLPPQAHIAKIILRGSLENKLCNAAQDLYNKLVAHRLCVYGPFKGQPYKIRGSFRYSLIVKMARAEAESIIIKQELYRLRSGRLHYAFIIK